MVPLLVPVLRLWSVSDQTMGACPLWRCGSRLVWIGVPLSTKKPLGQSNPSWCAVVHLGTLKSFLGQLGLLLLVGPFPSETWLSGVLVPDLCRGRLRAPC